VSTTLTYDTVVFDFDGVLNRSYDAAGFIWSRNLERDFGFTSDALDRILFRNDFSSIVTGARDLAVVLDEVLPAVGARCTSAEFMDYWFRSDLMPCHDLLGLIDQLRASGVRCVLGTNNERHRAAYIWETLLKDRMDALYTSGLMGLAKPDVRFFRRIQDESGCPPGRILMIDDIAENVAAARALGWEAHHYGDFSKGRLGAPDEVYRLFSAVTAA
jgi:putative hydrolase of the HAD superfamily